LLSTEAIKGSKVMLTFESETKELKIKAAESSLKAKTEALKEFTKVFARCYDY